MKRIVFILILLIQFSLSAQKENNIWYFGQNAGIDFNGGAPVVLTNGALNTLEGCSSISSFDGVLQFYTDGITVWNRNHQIMQNGTGLKGSISSTQSALIVKKPGTTNIYYIFTTDDLSGPDGFRYSEVDMNLDGGLGAVNSNKNSYITDKTGEKITAVKHQNGTDYWVITRKSFSNAFHSYLITCAGLDTMPIISNVGIPGNGIIHGYLKGSHDGTRIASTCAYLKSVELLDFDNQTGLLNNPILLNNLGGFFGEHPYGIEFSPNNHLLYVSISGELGICDIFQFNLLAGSPTAIETSKTLIGSHPGSSGAIQLAPNIKIYHASNSKNYLGVINNPNVIGTSCNYVANGISLSGKNSSLGLPNIYTQNTPLPIINIGNDSSLCEGETIALNAATSDATYLWSDNSTIPTYNVTQQGEYWVEVTVNNCELLDTIIIKDKKCSALLQLPNIFTPNNDGINDFFTALVNKNIVSMKTIIYNRWGKEVFKTNDLLIEWEVQNHNSGTYFCVVNYTDNNGVKYFVNGYLTLIR